MILVLTIIVLAVAWGARFLLVRYGSGISAANAVPVAIVIAFAFGYTVAPHSGPQSTGDSRAATGDATTAAAPVAAAPAALTPLSAAELAKLHVEVGAGPGYVDGFTRGKSTTLEHSPAFAHDDTGRVSGWVVDAQSQPATALVAVVDGAKPIDVTPSYGGSRPDVATYLKNGKAVDVGFSVSLPLAHLAAGSHRVAIGAVGPDRATVNELRPVSFTIR